MPKILSTLKHKAVRPTPMPRALCKWDKSTCMMITKVAVKEGEVCSLPSDGRLSRTPCKADVTALDLGHSTVSMARQIKFTRNLPSHSIVFVYEPDHVYAPYELKHATVSKGVDAKFVEFKLNAHPYNKGDAFDRACQVARRDMKKGQLMGNLTFCCDDSHEHERCTPNVKALVVATGETRLICTRDIKQGDVLIRTPIEDKYEDDVEDEEETSDSSDLSFADDDDRDNDCKSGSNDDNGNTKATHPPAKDTSKFYTLILDVTMGGQMCPRQYIHNRTLPAKSRSVLEDFINTDPEDRTIRQRERFEKTMNKYAHRDCDCTDVLDDTIYSHIYLLRE